jgi:penicillin amidase
MKSGLIMKSQPPIIDRDENNVIHVTAQNEYDLLYAQGVAMAQERLFQMDLQRRVGRGLVSEIVGAPGLNIDKLMRTLGIFKKVEEDSKNLPTETKKKLQCFVDGINAYLKSDQPLTIEFWLLGYQPKLWTIDDVLVNVKIMAWTLDGNLNPEILRYIMQLNNIPLTRITSTLFPPYPATSPTIINPGNTINNVAGRKLQSVGEEIHHGAYIPTEQEKQNGPHVLADYSDMEEYLPGVAEKGSVVEASNNWVLGGNITDSGSPLLACDTHLSISALGHYLLMHLRVDPSGKYEEPKPSYEMEVIGASLVGLPTIVIGRNGNGIAWGMTNAGADVKDFFVIEEKTKDTSYILNGVAVDYGTRVETINVKDSSPVKYTVKTTTFGPVMNDALQLPGTKPLSLKWMGTAYKGTDATVETFFKLMRAANWTQFKSAFESYVGPAQNFVYADDKNNIGYILPGQFPVRKGNFNGLFPTAGTGKNDWDSTVTQDFANVPNAMLTPQDQGRVSQPYFFSANNKPYVTSAVTVSSDWMVDDFRAVRIDQLIKDKTTGGRKMMFSDMVEMQLDTTSSIFKRHQGILQRIGEFTGNGAAQDVELFRQKLIKWDGVEANNKETTVFEEWIFNLATLAGKEVNITFEFTSPNHGQDPSVLERQRFFSHRYVFGVIEAEYRGTNTTIEKNCVPYGGCVQFARKMFELSVNDLKARFGNVPTWGELIHWSNFNHPIFGQVAALQCVSCRRVFTKGGTQTLNVAPPTLGMDRFASNFGPTYRQLIDLKNPEQSKFIGVMGQSGNMLSQFYDNYLTLWKRGEYIPMRMRGYTIQSRVTF